MASSSSSSGTNALSTLAGAATVESVLSTCDALVTNLGHVTQSLKDVQQKVNTLELKQVQLEQARAAAEHRAAQLQDRLTQCESVLAKTKPGRKAAQEKAAAAAAAASGQQGGGDAANQSEALTAVKLRLRAKAHGGGLSAEKQARQLAIDALCGLTVSVTSGVNNQSFSEADRVAAEKEFKANLASRYADPDTQPMVKVTQEERYHQSLNVFASRLILSWSEEEKKKLMQDPSAVSFAALLPAVADNVEKDWYKGTVGRWYDRYRDDEKRRRDNSKFYSNKKSKHKGSGGSSAAKASEDDEEEEEDPSANARVGMQVDVPQAPVPPAAASAAAPLLPALPLLPLPVNGQSLMLPPVPAPPVPIPPQPLLAELTATTPAASGDSNKRPAGEAEPAGAPPNQRPRRVINQRRGGSTPR